MRAQTADHSAHTHFCPCCKQTWHAMCTKKGSLKAAQCEDCRHLGMKACCCSRRQLLRAHGLPAALCSMRHDWMPCCNADDMLSAEHRYTPLHMLTAGLRTAPAAAAHPHARCLTTACKPFRSPCKQSMMSSMSTTRSARIAHPCSAHALAATRHVQCTDAYVVYLACMSPAPVQAHARAQLTRG